MYPDDSLFQLGNRRGTGDDYADVDGDQVDMIPPEQIADDSTANNDPNAKNMTALDGTEANVYKNVSHHISALQVLGSLLPHLQIHSPNDRIFVITSIQFVTIDRNVSR